MGKLAAASMTSTVTRTRATRLEVVMVMVPSSLALAPGGWTQRVATCYIIQEILQILVVLHCAAVL